MTAFRGVVWVSLLLAPLGTARAAEACRDDLTAGQNFWIRRVSTRAWGGWAPAIQYPLAPGMLYDPSLVSADLEAAARAYRNERAGESLSDSRRRATRIDNTNQFSVTYVTSCVQIVEPALCAAASASIPAPGSDRAPAGGQLTITTPAVSGRPQPDRCVDLVVKPFHVAVPASLVSTAALAGRPNRASFPDEVPRPLQATRPSVDFHRDRAFGVSQSLQLSTDLLQAGRMIAGGDPSPGPTQLNAEIGGRVSFIRPRYDAAGSLSLVHSETGLLNKYGAGVRLGVEREPRQGFDLLRNSVEPNGFLVLQSISPWMKSLYLGGNFRYSKNRFGGDGLDETAVGGRVVWDSRAAAYTGGKASAGKEPEQLKALSFFRVAAWGEHSAPGNSAPSYNRAVVMGGTSTEWLVRPNQSVGAEVVGGVGNIWGDAPPYAQFYGGNQLSDLLASTPASLSASGFPVGPLLRSYGVGELGSPNRVAAGASQFWNLSANLTVPIPQWSSVLIPNENVGDEGDVGFTLRNLLKAGVTSARNALVSKYRHDGAANPEADADRTISVVKPGIYYLSDAANLFALKPLFMFDAAGLKTFDGRRTTLTGVGAGLQLTLVIVRFELGYMHTVSAPDYPRAGNVIFRFKLQNLF